MDDDEQEFPVYSTADEAKHAIGIALAENRFDHDIEAIFAQTFSWTIETDDDGNELLNTGGYQQVVTDDEFWEIVEENAY